MPSGGPPLGDVTAARELATEDDTFVAEAERLDAHRLELEERLRRLLVPRDEADSKDAILEIKAGEGGEESALFAGDLMRMYTRYAERRGWKTELLDETASDLGGRQVGHGRGQGEGRQPSPARRRTPC